MPTPHTEEPERFPGGADALEDESRYGEIPDGPVGVDLPPDKNPATAEHKERVPDVSEPDDKQQEPHEADSGEDTPSEPPA
jgi:hypothetical protein